MYRSKKLELRLDTGAIINDKPVITSISFTVLSTATTQQLYDAAYALAEYSEYQVYSIAISLREELDPID